MHTPVRKTILIHHTGGRTSRRSADRYVARGHAEYIGPNVIRFRDAAIRSGYDEASHSGRATLRELRGIPFVGPLQRMA